MEAARNIRSEPAFRERPTTQTRRLAESASSLVRRHHITHLTRMALASPARARSAAARPQRVRPGVRRKCTAKCTEPLVMTRRDR